MAKGYRGGSFGGGMSMGGGMRQSDLMKQAQKMQQDMLKRRRSWTPKHTPLRRAAALSRRRSTASASSSRSRIDPEAVDPDDVEMLQDMVIGGGQFRAQGGGDLPRGEHGEGHRRAELRLLILNFIMQKRRGQRNCLRRFVL